MIPVPLSLHSYKSRARPISQQRLVNLYAEASPPDGKAPAALIGIPGLVPFATAGVGPVRGAHVMAGILYVVSGFEVYSIDKSGVVRFLGTIVGEDSIGMADNGFQLAIASGQKGYIYDTTTNVFQQITDPNFRPVVDVDEVDGYFVWAQAESGIFFNSKLRDGLSYDPLDFATAESRPDDLVALQVDKRLIWAFGTDSVEVWYNAGNADFPFSRVSGGVIEQGTVSSESVAELDNTIFWLSEGKEGGFAVYRANGFQPVRVSEHSIELRINALSVEKIQRAAAFGYEQEGHKFYVLTFPGEFTVVYDTSTSLWHERESRDELNAPLGTWRAATHAFAYGLNLMGSVFDGKIFRANLDVATDDGFPIVAIGTTPTLHNNGEKFSIPMMQFDMMAGVGLPSGQGQDPQIMVQISRDGGNIYGTERWESFGQMGDYTKRARFWRNGQGRDVVARYMISDPVPRAAIRMYLDRSVSF